MDFIPMYKNTMISVDEILGEITGSTSSVEVLQDVYSHKNKGPAVIT